MKASGVSKKGWFLVVKHQNWRCGWMVNVDRVKRKLPSLLCDGETGGGTNDNKFKKHRYRLARFFGAGMKPLF